MGEEEPRPVADQVGGGQIAADQQGGQVRGQFGIGKIRPVRLLLDHVGDQIVTGRRPTFGQCPPHVGAKRLD